METLGLVTAEINHGGRDQVKLQYTTGEVDMSQTVKRIHTAKKSVDWSGLSVRLGGYSVRLSGYSGNANSNYLNTFQ